MLPMTMRRVVSSAAHSPVASTAVFVGVSRVPSPNLPSSSFQQRSLSTTPTNCFKNQSPPAKLGDKNAASKTADRKLSRSSPRLLHQPDAAVRAYYILRATREQCAHVALASFWSMHRPISLHQAIPESITDEQFAAIFSPGENQTDLHDLEAISPCRRMSILPEPAEIDGLPAFKVQVELESDEELSVLVPTDPAAPQFLPPLFQPSEMSDSTEPEVAESQLIVSEPLVMAIPISDSSHYSTIVNTQDFLEPSTEPLADGTRSLRRIKTLSVVRIRRLKINKKKYKKLQKRLKLERRKLERK